MKIALVNNSFSLSHGGLERFSVNLATTLAETGHEVHAFGQRFSDLPPAVTIHPLQVPRKPAWRRIIAFHRGAARSVQGHDFDVIYGLARFFPLDIYRMGDGVQRHWLRLRYPFAPWRWFNCLINPAHLANLWLERRIFRDTDCRIVTNSRLCKEQAQAYYGVAAHRIDVVYNGVDHQLFNPERLAPLRNVVRGELGLQPADIAVLHVSNNWSRKGLAILLRAIASQGKAGQHLHAIVVGRGRPTPFLKLAQKLGISERVHLVGETREVDKYYGASDLMVLPTMYDPFSNVCLEAMACALPVITTAQNGAAELIRPGKNGFIQKHARDAGELADLLGQCLDPVRLSVMGQVARQVAQPFTREQNMLETLGVFERITEQRQSSVRPEAEVGDLS